jgi:hypothetical protein
MPEQDNIYPLVMEAIDLVKSIDPWQHFENLSQMSRNTISPKAICSQQNSSYPKNAPSTS